MQEGILNQIRASSCLLKLTILKALCLMLVKIEDFKEEQKVINSAFSVKNNLK